MRSSAGGAGNDEVDAPSPEPRRGRPRSSRAQEAVTAAASKLFAERGFTGSSVRDIAAEAGVDPALVIRHFGSKEALFLQTMTVADPMHGLVEGPVETLGRTILTHLLEDTDGSLLVVYRALIGALDRPEVQAYVERSVAQNVVGPLRERLTGPDVDLRARLVAAQISGLLLSLAVIPDPVLKDAPLPHLLDVFAPALQRLIDEPT